MANIVGDDVDITSYRGMERNRTRAQTSIREVDLGTTTDGIAYDQAILHQTLTGTKLSGGAISGDAHDHDGTRGQRLGLPISHVNFQQDWVPIGTAMTENRGLGWRSGLIRSDTTASNPERIVARWPVFIPSWVDDLVIYVRGSRSLFSAFGLKIKIHTTSFVLDQELAPSYVIQPEDGSIINQFDLTPTSTSAVYIFTAEVNLSLGTSDRANINDIVVMPKNHGRTNSPQVHGPDAAQLGATTAVRTASWNSIYDTFIDDESPLTPYFTRRAAENDGMLFEELTGSPQPGQASAATSGHNHDGSNSALIDMPILSTGLGWVQNYTTDSADGLDADQGFHGAAPIVDDTTASGVYANMAYGTAQAPASTLTTFKWAMVAYANETDTGNILGQMGTSDAIAATPTNTDTGSSAVGSGGWKYISGTSLTQASTSGAYEQMNYIIAAIGSTASKNTREATLTGFCLYTED